MLYSEMVSWMFQTKLLENDMILEDFEFGDYTIECELSIDGILKMLAILIQWGG